MNSHRDNVKDAVKKCFTDRKQSSGEISEIVYEIADAVFDALGITSDEQDKRGGYFMLHAGVKPEGRDSGYDDAIESQTGEEGLPDMEYDEELEEEAAEHEKRLEELESGSKYTFEEFLHYSTSKWVEETGGWYITLQTPICKYGQAYDKGLGMDEAKSRFQNSYYPIYLEDYERSKEIAEVDKKQV